jgi:hypothetical protein
LLLSASFFPLLLTFCSMVLAPLCVIGLAAINPPAPADSLCPIYLVTLFELIGLLNLLSVLASGQVAISRHSVQVFKPYCHRVICWRDIVRVRLQSNGSFVLESTNQDLITIDSCVTGLPEFIEALERFLPAEVRLDCQGELDDYRNFVGLGDSIRHDRG